MVLPFRSSSSGEPPGVAIKPAGNWKNHGSPNHPKAAKSKNANRHFRRLFHDRIVRGFGGSSFTVEKVIMVAARLQSFCAFDDLAWKIQEFRSVMPPVMKSKFFIAAFAASLIFAAPASADEDNPLAKQMEVMNDAYKAMRRLEDLTKGPALAREAQDAMIKAIVETPEMVKAMPDGPDKAKASAQYRIMMGNLIATLAQLELAFLDGDKAKVDEIIGKMRDSKKEGHDKFMEDE